MLPLSDSPPPYSKPKTPDILDRKHSYLTSLKPYLSLHHRRTWFFLAVLLLQLLLLLSAPSLPFSISAATPHPSPASAVLDVALIPENITSNNSASAAEAAAADLGKNFIAEKTNSTQIDSVSAATVSVDSSIIPRNTTPTDADASAAEAAADLNKSFIPDETNSTHISSTSAAAVSADSSIIPENTTSTDTAAVSTADGAVIDHPESCPYGKFYIYDLPPRFNTEIVKNCNDINPWSSRCDALSNGGFGKSAAAGVSAVVPESVAGAWFWTDQFSLELIYHNRMLHHRCRTPSPDSAKAFYIPFYLGLAIERSIFTKNSSMEERDRPCNLLLDWVSDQPFFQKSYGWDHFITLGRISWDFRRQLPRSDWGSSCIYMPKMRNITRLLIEKNPWDYFDVAVPYPTGFHPSSVSDVATWQDFVRSRNRRTLFSFAGATRGFFKNDFRGILLNQCYAANGSCRVVDCGGSRCANGSSAILETFLDSDFCLQPRGDSFTRRSIFDCMVAGSVPVFFWHRTAYMQYEWFLPSERGSYSVFIHRNEVKNGTNIIDVLNKFSREDVRKMREKVIEYIPRIVYANNNNGLEGMNDAFDVAVEGFLRRVKEQEGGYRW